MESVASIFHISGTCKIGTQDDDSVVVDNKFKFKGIEGLRVVDLSVLPLKPSCHPVSWAYLAGWTRAETLIKEYGYTRSES